MRVSRQSSTPLCVYLRLGIDFGDTLDVTFGKVAHRHLNIKTLPLPGAKLAVRGRATIQFGEDNSLNLKSLVQLCHDSQTKSIASALKKLVKEKDTTITDALRRISENLDRQGLDVLMEEGRIDGFLARPRALELGMALNRLVSGKVWIVVEA